MVLGGVAGVAVAASAQFNQTISVEGKYVPEVIRQERLNTFPKSVKFALESTPLSYEGRGVTAPFTPQLTAMPATGWRDTRSWSDKKGYVLLGSGSWLNSVLDAGYRIWDDDEKLLGFKVGHSSTSLWQPKLSERTADTKRWRYDESVGVFGARNLGDWGRLSGEADYHYGTFNYYGYNPQWLPVSVKPNPTAPDQKLNDVALRVKWDAPSATLRGKRFLWDLSLGARYFGFRNAYATHTEKVQDIGPITVEKGVSLDPWRGTRESHLNFGGSCKWLFANESSLGAKVSADLLHYDWFGGRTMSRGVDNQGIIFDPYYSVIRVNPYYDVSFDNLRFHIGVRGDYTAFAEKNLAASSYPALHFAPDVRGEFTYGMFKSAIEVGGGTQLSTLASRYEQDYYTNPSLSSVLPIYTPLDAKVSAGVTPGYGLSVEGWFAYRKIINAPQGGWYQAALNYGDKYIAYGLPLAVTTADGDKPLSYNLLFPGRVDLQGFSVGGAVGYEYGKWIRLRAAADWQPQSNGRGYYNGYDRAERTLEVSVESNPWSTLRLGANYSYRGNRRIYINGWYATETFVWNGQEFSTAWKSQEFSTPLGSWSMLGASASYSFSCGGSVWLQVNNLLNRHTARFPCLPEPGIQLMAGVGYLF